MSLKIAADNTKCQHPGWQEEYYGWRCTHCPTFIPFGGEPWAPDGGLLNLADALVEDLMETPDDELMAEASRDARRDDAPGGLRSGAARWLGFDAMCRCGHDEGSHDRAGRCAVLFPSCECQHFTLCTDQQ